MKTFLTISLCMLTIALFSQDRARITIDIPTEQKPWNNIELNNDPGNFQFAIVTDRTGGHRPGVFLKGIQKLNLLQPEFVMSVGDLIEGYTKDTIKLNTQWKEFNGFIDSLSVPFFYVPGNHDITNKVMEDKWNQIFGVSWYHFVYNDVLFLCLNSEDNYRGAGRGTLDDEQYEYIKKALEENKNVRWTMVFLHQPLWVQNETKRWPDVVKLLGDRPHNVFAGHYHRYWKTEQNNGKYIALATTGGGSRLRGTAYGEFDHVVWVTMTDQGPILANLLLEGIWDENVVTNDLVEFVRNKPFPVKIEPVFLENKSLEKAVAEVRITNDSDYKMKLEIDGNIHPDLHYQFENNKIEVQPNSVELTKLIINNINAKDLTALDPLKVEMKAIFDYPNRPELAIDKSVNFSLLYKNPIKEVGKRIKMDGKLKEWDADWMKIGGLKHISRNRFFYEGDEDCSMKFATQYDDKFLYIGIEVMDNDLYSNEDRQPWQQDAIVLAMDGRSINKSMFNTGAQRGKEWLYLVRSLKENDHTQSDSYVPDETQTAVIKTDSGISMEIAIPLSHLEKFQGKDWTHLRLGIGYLDFDKEGKERNDLFWFPAWNASNTIDGSGMFFRK